MFNILDEVQGKGATIRIKVGEGGPFSSGSATFLVKILDYDPIVGIWKVMTEGGDGTIGYFPHHIVQTIKVLTEEEYAVEFERAKKATKEIEEEYQARRSKVEETETESEDKWYGDPTRILEFLSKTEKESER